MLVTAGSWFCSAFGVGAQDEELSALSRAEEQKKEVLLLVSKGLAEKLSNNVLAVVKYNWNTIISSS